MTIFNFDWPAFWSTASSLSWYEVAMLVCFGASWPFSIAKMLRTGRSEGKSYIFLVLVMFGYIFGLIHKLLYHLDVVVLLYAALFFVVLTDCLICVKVRKKARLLEQQAAEQKAAEQQRAEQQTKD